MKVNVAKLRNLGASPSLVNFCRDLHGEESFPLDRKSCLALQHRLDFSWLAQNLLSDPLWQEYQKAAASIGVVYETTIRLAETKEEEELEEGSNYYSGRLLELSIAFRQAKKAERKTYRTSRAASRAKSAEKFYRASAKRREAFAKLFGALAEKELGE